MFRELSRITSKRVQSRSLRVELLEDRRLLAKTADIVFLLDESGSEGATHSWLSSIVDQLDATLRTTHGIDVRYGLVGFGQTGRFAHSHIVGSDSSLGIHEKRWSDGNTATDHTDDIKAALATLVADGDSEDGWDAIDHAISEYDFRSDAVPIFVLVQGEDKRVVIQPNGNPTLTHDGILSALQGKNIILNTLTVGIPDLVSGTQPLFDLSPYGLNSDIRVLGVEADVSDGVTNGVHNYHSVDTDTTNGTQQPTATTADTLQISYNGSNTGASGMVASGKSVLIGENISGGIGETTFGYSAKSVPFEMVSMSGASTHTAGTAIPSYSFNFFGTTYANQVYVNADGTITFGAANSSGANVYLSRNTAEPRPSQAMIAALWDDLGTVAGLGGSSLRRRSVDVDGDTLVDMAIQWTGYRFDEDDFPHDTVTFQVVLFADGRIQFNYQDIDSFPGNRDDNGTPDDDLTVANTGGLNATVGIWKGGVSPVDAVSIVAGKFVPGPHDINGAFELNAEGDPIGETNDSYVRMAWDTGGAAWDAGAITTAGDDLRDAFIESLADQINAANAAGKVSRNDNVLFAYNLGGNAIATEGFAADPNGTSGSISTTSSIDTTSNSVPKVGAPLAKVHDVFKTARTASSSADIDLSYSALADGAYIVELFFAEIASNVNAANQAVFDILLEGKIVLNNYDVFDDHGRVVLFDDGSGPSSTELDVATIGQTATQLPAGVVKRFLVDVSSANGSAGLQVSLDRENAPLQPLFINGLRILRAGGPRVQNVTISSTEASSPDPPYSFDTVDGDERQLQSIPVGGARRVAIRFSEQVNVQKAHLRLIALNEVVTEPLVSAATFVAPTSGNNFTATWTFTAELPRAQ